MTKKKSHPHADEPEADEPDTEAAAEPKAAEPKAAAPVTLKRFRVSLPHQPETDVDAVDKHHAVQLYKERNGILDTDHTYSVHELTDSGPVQVMGQKPHDDADQIDMDEALGGPTT